MEPRPARSAWGPARPEILRIKAWLGVTRTATRDYLDGAALDDLLENGTLADWRPVLALVRREPYGEVARKIEALLRSRDYEETGALWGVVLADARGRMTGPPAAG